MKWSRALGQSVVGQSQTAMLLGISREVVHMLRHRDSENNISIDAQQHGSLQLANNTLAKSPGLLQSECKSITMMPQFSASS